MTVHRDEPDVHPPRPRLSLRVGVTGHRPGGDRLTQQQLPAIEAAISALLSLLKAGLSKVKAEAADIFEAAPPALRLVSPLAEGADRAAAHAALAQGFDLHCPLPFARSEYEKDFRTEASLRDFRALIGKAAAVMELPGIRGADERAYETVGLMVLRQADLLIAVWDGSVKANRRGGTAEIVTQAYNAGLPIIWIAPSDPKLRLIDKASLPPGTSLWEIESFAEPLTAERIDRLLWDLMAPPGTGHGKRAPGGADAQGRILQFFGEVAPAGGRFWFAYPLLVRLLGGKPDVHVLPTPARATVPATAPDNDTAFAAVLAPRYAWADRLSVHLGRVYRSSYVMNFGLAAFAVLFALLGLVLAHDLKPVFAFVELLLISGILLLTTYGTRGRWHDRWVDYRQLAEQLRHLRFLCLTGTRTPDGRGDGKTGAEETGPAWIGWYYRATLRELPLPHARVDAAYNAHIREALLAELGSQCRYHAQNAQRQHTIHAWLDRFGVGGFALTFGVCFAFVASAAFDYGLHVFGHHQREVFMHLVTFLGGTLPAFGAAFYAIRVQGEFKLGAERSAVTAEHLGALYDKLAAEPSAGFGRLAGIADETAAIMSAELTDWSMIFRSKPLSLPA